MTLSPPAPTTAQEIRNTLLWLCVGSILSYAYLSAAIDYAANHLPLPVVSLTSAIGALVAHFVAVRGKRS